MTAEFVRERVVVALDCRRPAANEALVDLLGDRVLWYKVGLSLFIQRGPELVSRLLARGRRIFLDLKLHDIPSTVARSVSAVCDLGADLVTIHAVAGARALSEAAQAAASHGEKRTRLLAVTVLTSQAGTPEEVLSLATMARQNGADGVICSPREAARIRAELGRDFLIVTPGIRWATADDDQTRTAEPRAALSAGADLLVIGRPIYAAADPLAALGELEATLG